MLLNLVSSAVPVHRYLKTTYQNRFRGIPAISRLDWSFTTYHNSSKFIATNTGSVHYDLVMVRSPGFGSIFRYFPTTIFIVVAFAKYYYK